MTLPLDNRVDKTLENNLQEKTELRAPISYLQEKQ